MDDELIFAQTVSIILSFIIIHSINSMCLFVIFLFTRDIETFQS